MGNCNELAVINVSPLYVYVYDRRALMSHNTATADDGLVRSASDGNRQRRAYWSDCGEQRRQWTSLSLSRQSVAVEDIEYTGAQLGKVPTGVCLEIKNKRDDPGRESISLLFLGTHTDSEKPFNHSTKEIPKEKIPEMYIQENATVTGTHRHRHRGGSAIAERERSECVQPK